MVQVVGVGWLSLVSASLPVPPLATDRPFMSGLAAGVHPDRGVWGAAGSITGPLPGNRRLSHRRRSFRLK